MNYNMPYTVADICTFDTETTGLIGKGLNYKDDYDFLPHAVSIAWIFEDREEYHIIKPEGYVIPEETTLIHGVTTEHALQVGSTFEDVVERFVRDAERLEFCCAHNIYYDNSILKAGCLRRGLYDLYERLTKAIYKGKRVDTLYKTNKFVGAKNKKGGAKIPNLQELYGACFPGEVFEGHNALNDVRALHRCLPVLIEKGIIELKHKEYPNENVLIEPKENPPFVSHEEGSKLKEKMKLLNKEIDF